MTERENILKNCADDINQEEIQVYSRAGKELCNPDKLKKQSYWNTWDSGKINSYTLKDVYTKSEESARYWRQDKPCMLKRASQHRMYLNFSIGNGVCCRSTYDKMMLHRCRWCLVRYKESNMNLHFMPWLYNKEKKKGKIKTTMLSLCVINSIYTRQNL